MAFALMPMMATGTSCYLSYNNHRFSELALIVANEGRELTG
jgi:hypothetical protein